MRFRDEARNTFKKHIDVMGDGWWHPKTSMGEFLDALTALHEREVERIIGEDDIDHDRLWPIPGALAKNELRAEQRRRANGEGEK